MDIYLYGLFILLAFVFGARTIIFSANSELTDNQKEQLIEIFSKSSIRNFSILLLLLVLFFLNINLKYTTKTINLIVYILAVGILLTTSCSSACKKLKEANFSLKYIRAYLWSIVLRTLGLVIFFAIVVGAG